MNKDRGKLKIVVPEKSSGFFYLMFEDGIELATVYSESRLPEATAVRDTYNNSLNKSPKKRNPLRRKINEN